MVAEKRKQKAGPTAKKWFKARTGAKPTAPVSTGTKRVSKVPTSSTKRSCTVNRVDNSRHMGFNPLFNKRISYPQGQSPFVVVPSRSNGNLETNTTTSAHPTEEYLVIFWSGSCLRGVHLGSTAAIYDLKQEILNTNLLVQVGPLGMALNMRNITKADDVCGEVKVLVSAAPLFYEVSSTQTHVTPATLQSLRDIFAGSADVRTYTAEHLRETKTISSFPCNQAKTLGFEYGHTIAARTLSTADATHSNEHAVQAMKDASMAPIVIQFPLSTVKNQYSFAIHCTDRCRFAQNSIMGSQHVNPPQMDIDTHNAAVRAASASAGAALALPPSMQ